ncbi:MAG: hypothetical protein SGPRY_007953, partial [Prymnesium sp.]
STACDIKRIFISHLHGDHVFGLPGLLCRIAASAVERFDANMPKYTLDDPLVIVGPRGLRAFIRTTLINSYASMKGLKMRIHELDGFKCYSRGNRMRAAITVSQPHPNEVPGEQIFPEADGSWLLPEVQGGLPLHVRAVEMDHTVPTVGWIVTERPRPGMLNAMRILPLLEKHGISRRALRNIKAGRQIDLPNGEVIRPEDHVQPSTQRKFAILSDSRDVPEGAALHARDATLVVHESTNAFTSVDVNKSDAEVHKVARSRGHSTPQMAGRFAQNVNADHLVLTHFSSRYHGSTSAGSVRIMSEIRELARQEFAGDVTCASDLMLVTVSANGSIRISDDRDIVPMTEPS